MAKKEYAIEVLPNTYRIITASGMFDDEAYDVRLVIDRGGKMDEQDDVPFCPCGQSVALTMKTNPVVLTIPGRYRLVARGVVNDKARLFVSEAFPNMGGVI